MVPRSWISNSWYSWLDRGGGRIWGWVGVITLGLYTIFTFRGGVGNCASTKLTKVDNVWLRIWLIGVQWPWISTEQELGKGTDILSSKSVLCPYIVEGNKTKTKALKVSGSSALIYSDKFKSAGKAGNISGPEKKKNREVYTPESTCMKRTSVHINNMWLKQLGNHEVWDFSMAFRVWKLFGIII